ncbi:MAG TPA: tyrosine-type recombinase/integrase [Aldersonia sp.]
MTTLAPTLQSYFTDRLIRQRQASSHTIAAYRDAFRLLLRFAEQRTGTPPSQLRIDDLDAPLIGAFLDHLEHDRGNSTRTRNARLAAIHSMFRYAALQHPEHAQLIQRVLAIPTKRFDRAIVTYLTDLEAEALLTAPDRTSWIGRRDHTILATMIQTGLRASELVGLDCRDVTLGIAAHINCLGKGRKQRITPLTRTTAAVLGAWIAERGGQPADPLFHGRTGTRLSRDTLERRITKHAAVAALSCPSIATKTVSPHTLRHTAAMRLLAARTDTSIIALWLGHESVATTQIYAHADLGLKEQALARTAPINTTPGRYQPDDTLLQFLEGL